MRIIKRAEARRRALISRTTEWRRLRDDPAWPTPIHVGPGIQGYIEDEITAFLEGLANDRIERPARAGQESGTPQSHSGIPDDRPAR